MSYCKNCDNKGHVAMVEVNHGYLSAFACNCQEGRKTGALKLQPWNGKEYQEYKNEMYRKWDLSWFPEGVGKQTAPAPKPQAEPKAVKPTSTIDPYDADYMDAISD